MWYEGILLHKNKFVYSAFLEKGNPFKKFSFKKSKFAHSFFLGGILLFGELRLKPTNKFLHKNTEPEFEINFLHILYGGVLVF